MEMPRPGQTTQHPCSKRGGTLRLGLTTAICVLKSPRQKCDLTKLLLHNRAEPSGDQPKSLVDEDADELEDDKAAAIICDKLGRNPLGSANHCRSRQLLQVELDLKVPQRDV